MAEALDLKGAVSKYSEALLENPEAFAPFIKRAQVYTKLKDYASAKSDIHMALKLAEMRGKMHEKALCYFRMGLVQYGEKKYSESLVSFRRAKELKCLEPSLEIWTAKADRDSKRLPQSYSESTTSTVNGDTSSSTTIETGIALNKTNDCSAANSNASADAELSKSSVCLDLNSTSLSAINKHAPLKVKIRDDWYQDNNYVTITIYSKNVDKNTVQTEFHTRSVAISFPSAENSEYNYNLDPLFDDIDVTASSCRVFSTKIELTLKKKTSGKWPCLEGSNVAAQLSISYPSSSKKAIDWSNFKVSDEADESEDFFAKLYKDVDEDTRRAMMKSYVESNGTVLTTNWAEAKLKTFEVSPPEGMEAKKW